jgi:hypothetical protein
MKSTILVIATILLVAVLAFSLQGKKTEDTANHVQWVENALKEMQTIKIGMTRKDLLTIFTTEGGFSSAQSRQYVYKKCPFIKVQVEFEPSQSSDKSAESPNDRIIKISKPYLEGSIIG